MERIPKDVPNFPIEQPNQNPNKNPKTEDEQAKKKAGLYEKLKPDPNSEGLGLTLIKEGVKRVSKTWKGASKTPEKVNNAALVNKALGLVKNNTNNREIEDTKILDELDNKILDEFMADEYQLQNDQKINSLNLQAFGDVGKVLPKVGDTIDTGFLFKSSSGSQTPKTTTPKITDSDIKKNSPKKTEEKK